MKVLFFAAQMVMGIAIPLALQLRDRKRLSAAERERVWNFASWGSALYAFGPISLIAWGYVTRAPRYWKGIFIGTALAEVAVLVQGALSLLLGVALGFSTNRQIESAQGVGATIVILALLAAVIGIARTVHDAVRGRL